MTGSVRADAAMAEAVYRFPVLLVIQPRHHPSR